MRFALSFLGEMIPFMLLALPVYLAARTLLVLRRRRRGLGVNYLREALLLVFVLFCLGLASQTVMPQMIQDMDGRTIVLTVFTNNPHFPSVGGFSSWRYNFVPFRTIGSYFGRGAGLFLVNIVGNVIMFAPLGFFVPLLWRKLHGFWRMTALGAAISCAIELAQVFILRSVDVDDVMLNTLGVLLGYGLYALLQKLWPSVSNRVKR